MHFKRIGEYLIEEQVCDEPTINQALAMQASLKAEGIFKPLGEVLHDTIGLAFKDVDRCLRKMHLDVLASTELFRDFSHNSLANTVSIAEQQVLGEGVTIFKQGDPAKTFCVVISGRVKVYLVFSDGAEKTLTELGPGEGFGEMALLTGEPRSASVKTLSPTSLLILSKNYFDQLCEINPEISAGFLKILSKRVIRGNEELVNATDSEKAYQHLVTLQNNIPYHPLVGTSRFINKLQGQIRDAAANNRPVYIQGEQGSMHIAIARAIHAGSARASAPLLYLNAQTITLDGTHANDEGLHDPMALELAQASALFGHDQGAMTLPKTRRFGLLHVCREGTVVIEHAEQLVLHVQEQLLEFLDTNTFRPLGFRAPAHSTARVMATSTVDLGRLAEEGRFLVRLYEHLAGQSITILPIRRRKADLRLITDKMIEHFNRTAGKTVKGIAPEAYQRVMGYDWPGNMVEIEIVFRRAVSLARGDYLLPEDIFLGSAPPQGKYTYNLFRQDSIRAFFTSRLYPWGLQAVMATIFSIIFVLAFLGSQKPGQNISLVLVWGLWWPLFTISWFVGARIWCAICPMGAVNDLLNRTCSLKLKVPVFIHNHGLTLSAIGLGVIIYVEAATRMAYSPMTTGFLLMSIAGFAILSGVLFERRLWCRYLCPLGRLAAVFSTTSLLEWRANTSICNSSCRTNTCYKGGEGVRGCPLYQGPFSLRSNHNCILCGNCVKICANNSPALNLRIPGHELWAAVKPEQVTAVFLPIILGTQFFRGLEQYHASVSPLQQLYGHWGGLAVLLLTTIAASFLFVEAGGKLLFGRLKDTAVRKGHLFSYAIVPLAFAFEFGYQLRFLFSRMGQFFPILGRQFGVSLEFLDFSTPAAAAKPWQVFAVLVGVVVSLFVQREIARAQEVAGPRHLGSLKSVPVLLLASVYIGLFAVM
jgi:transcriptional regulator with AAA-type ATPase domain/polyferredoxin